MRILRYLILLLPLQAVAKAPECPLYSNKKMCLAAVEDNYKNYLDYIRDEYTDESRPVELIQAANDIKHYEILACQKTCLN